MTGRSLLHGALATLLLANISAPMVAETHANATIVGTQRLQAHSEERQQTFPYRIWYPANHDTEITPDNIGENGIFYGQPAYNKATIADNTYPLVVISHGAGGNADQYGWLANPLVDAGFIVAAPNHPGSTTGNATGEEAVKVWKRPPDISRVIDDLLQRPELSRHVDSHSISALGFSAGGYTALALGGAQIDTVKLSQYCDHGTDAFSTCEFFEHFGIDLHTIDLSLADRDNRDSRIKTIVAIDPGLAETYIPDSLTTITQPTLLINLGIGDDIPKTVLASQAAKRIPDNQYVSITDAIHFSFLPECKPKAAFLLAEEGEIDPLCDDGANATRTRAEIHQELIGLIRRYLLTQAS